MIVGQKENYCILDCVRRDRLVTFRMSHEEYKDLCDACAAMGVDSISDFTRAGVRLMIGVKHAWREGALLECMGDLDRVVQRLKLAIEVWVQSSGPDSRIAALVSQQKRGSERSPGPEETVSVERSIP